MTGGYSIIKTTSMRCSKVSSSGNISKMYLKGLYVTSCSNFRCFSVEPILDALYTTGWTSNMVLHHIISASVVSVLISCF